MDLLHKKEDDSKIILFRGEGRDRTADARIFSPVLYRLSYHSDLVRQK